MSRIDDLIEQYAPEGVVHSPLGEVGTFIRGNGLQKKDLLDRGVPAIHYGQIHTVYGVWTTDTVSYVTPQAAARLRSAQCGDLVIATTSEDDVAVAKATAWLGDDPAAVSGDAYIYRHALEPKYVAYFFQSERFQEQKQAGITGTKVRRISGDALAKIRIPVPPAEVQREIVRVLDAFAELEAELEAELKARRQQYAYYRSLAFSADQIRADVWTRMGDVATVRYGRDFPKSAQGRSEGRYPFFKVIDMARPGNESTMTLAANYVDAADPSVLRVQLAPAGTIVMPRVGAAVGTNRKRVLGVEGAFDTSFIALLPGEAVLPRFLLYFLQGVDLLALSNTGAALPSVRRDALEELLVPVLPLGEQERVVAMLDDFDALVHDLSSGLPAEIEARRQQYAYYRDRLLTFKEAVA